MLRPGRLRIRAGYGSALRMFADGSCRRAGGRRGRCEGGGRARRGCGHRASGGRGPCGSRRCRPRRRTLSDLGIGEPESNELEGLDFTAAEFTAGTAQTGGWRVGCEQRGVKGWGWTYSRPAGFVGGQVDGEIDRRPVRAAASVLSRSGAATRPTSSSKSGAGRTRAGGPAASRPRPAHADRRCDGGSLVGRVEPASAS